MKQLPSLPALPYVSVIMPVRNEAAYIERSLQAVLDQDYPSDRVEVLVVDGSSSDPTAEIVRRMALSAQGRCIRLLHNPGRIVPMGFNKALSQSTGDIILRIDGHCTPEPDYIRRCVDTLHRTRAACVGGPMKTEGSSPIARAIALAQSSSFGVGSALFRTGCSAGAYVDTLAFGAYRREVFEQIGGLDEELVRNQDDEFNFRLVQDGGKIWLDPSIRSMYFSRSDFGRLWRQYYQYGLYKVRVIQKRRGVASWRQAVPILFVLTLAAGLLLGFLSGWWAGAAVVVILYLTACLAAGLWTTRHELPLLKFVIPAYVVLHLAYGTGSLYGLWVWRKKWNVPSTLPFPMHASGRYRSVADPVVSP